MFKRKVVHELEKWAAKKVRKPLVIRGARQVGKTTVINQFAGNFNQYLYLNLELPADRKPFQNFTDIQTLVQSIFFIKDLKYSDAVAFEQDKLLFLERANKKFKLVVADLSVATNVLDNPHSASLILEKEAENLDKLAVKPAQMREVFDSRDVFFQIDTDKLEGLALLNSSVVAISNDNDFGVGENTTAYPSKVWVIRLGKNLVNP